MEDDADGGRYFAGRYSLSMPHPDLFFLRRDQALEFSIDAAGVLTYAADVARLIEDHGLETRVEYEWIHPGPTDALGPLAKVTIHWIDDASPELLMFALFRQGGQSRPVVALAWACWIVNDGEARLALAHPQTKLEFTPPTDDLDPPSSLGRSADRARGRGAPDEVPSGARSFEGRYALSAPGLVFRGPPQTLDFSIDAAGVLTFTPECARVIEEHGVDVRVAWEHIHPHDPRDELGPVCKVSLWWRRGGAPEAYAFGLFRQGGEYRSVVFGCVLAWAYAIVNEGEAVLVPDPRAKIDFTPVESR